MTQFEMRATKDFADSLACQAAALNLRQKKKQNMQG